MTKQVSHDGRNGLHVSFPYDRRLVDLVKTLPNRRWLGEEKLWRVPDVLVVMTVDLLRGEGFAFDEVVRKLYIELGGTLTFDPVRVEAPSPPGPRSLFDPVEEDTAPSTDYTVGRLNREVRDLLDGAFPAPIWIVGEISGFAKAAHKRIVGFHLVERDPQGQEVSKVSATLFDDTRQEIARKLARATSPFVLQDEIQVRVLVRVDLFEPWGQYRVVIEDLDVSYTLGEAARRREEIVRRLTERGLVHRNTSLSFPLLPLRVGLVTSLGSDAFNDVVCTLQESGFAFSVTAHGARVQGRATEASVLNALDWFRDRADAFDVVLVCRGGGSRTDLGWFDSEALGVAVATFPLPVVVGIGHEQDLSVLDFVGWRRKTPTAAAGLLVERVQEECARVEERRSSLLEAVFLRIDGEKLAGRGRAVRLARAVRSRLDLERAALRTRRQRTGRAALTALGGASRELGRLSLALPRASVRLLEGRRIAVEQMVRQVVLGSRRDLAVSRKHVGDLAMLVGRKSRLRLVHEAERDETRARRLHLVDPRRVVERGYAILRSEGRVVTDAGAAPPGTAVRAEVRKGVLRLRSEGAEGSGGSGASEPGDR
jgi:exodeoxyribonuclease VII large subunit